MLAVVRCQNPNGERERPITAFCSSQRNESKGPCHPGNLGSALFFSPTLRQTVFSLAHLGSVWASYVRPWTGADEDRENQRATWPKGITDQPRAAGPPDACISSMTRQSISPGTSLTM